jgi:CMP/dCMP kinase
MASVVFPQADYKFYLDADVGVRIKRRHNELLGKGKKVELRSIHADMVKRDKQDSEREIAPLKPAPDVVMIDSTNFSVTEVVDKIMRHISGK